MIVATQKGLAMTSRGRSKPVIANFKMRGIPGNFSRTFGCPTVRNRTFNVRPSYVHKPVFNVVIERHN